MARPSKLHEHRGKWRCRIGGVEHVWDTKAEATGEFHRLMGKHLADTNNTDRPHTVAGAVEKWLALNPTSAYGPWLATLIEFAGREYLADLTRDTLTRYHLHLKAQRVKRNTYDAKTKTWGVKETDKALSTGTIRHYLKAAAAVLEWARAQGWLECEPVAPKVPKAARKARDVEPGKLAEVLDDLPKLAGHILRFIAFTGCRPSEACNLEWKHVNLAARVCTLDVHKTMGETGEPRTLYLTDAALAILQALEPDDPEGYVFTSRLGTPYTPAGLRAILRRHGGFTPYQLRHSFAQQVSDSGEVPVEVLSKLLGHHDMKTTTFYFKVRDRRAGQAAKNIRLKIA